MKPIKPYDSFPLTPHVRGGWGKKYKGHQLYISPVDPDKALAEFHRRARAIDNDKPAPPSKKLGDMTVGELVNQYVDEREHDYKAGKLSMGTLQNYKYAAVRMAKHLGRDTLIDDLIPDDFTRMHRRLAEALGGHALARAVQGIRTIFKYAADNDWIDRTPRYGSVFRKRMPARKTSAVTVEAARCVLAASAGQLRAMILLALNGGYTPKDCADLPRAAIDWKLGTINFPRPKMKDRHPIDRVMVMWPETADSLREVIAAQKPNNLVFLTVHGNPWVVRGESKTGKAGGTNSVGLMYRRAGKPIGVSRFDDLRHLHRTIADELEKPNAAARLMGHRLPGLADVYVDSIEHNRIRVLTDHIRSRINPGTAPACPLPVRDEEPVPSPSRPTRKPPVRNDAPSSRRSSSRAVRQT